MVEEQDVRDFLNKITDDRLHADSIAKQIEIANVIVENEKSPEASEELVEDATLVQAGYLSYLAYATEFERSVGKVPMPMLIHIDRLERLAKQFLGYVKRGDSTIPNIAGLLVVTDTVSKRFRTLRYSGSS